VLFPLYSRKSHHHSTVDYTSDRIKFLESIADSKKLLKSIGTDFHWKGSSEYKISFDVEGINPDETIITVLESRMGK